MNKQKFFILICIILFCVTIIFLTVYSETRKIKLPTVNGVDIHLLNSTLNTELNGEEKKTIYSILQNTDTVWKPFDSYPKSFSGKDLITVSVTGNTVPYSLTITALPNGDSFNKRKPYAFVQFNGGHKYRIVNNLTLFNYLKKYIK